MKIKGLLVSSCLALGVLAGCSGDLNVSAEEIITNVLEADKELKSYYAEGEMKFFEGDTLKEAHLMKEYVNENGKKKVMIIDKNTKNETVSVNDGKELITYDKKENKAFKIDVSSLDLPEKTQREQLIAMMEALKDTHNYEIIGEEKVNGFLTHHVKLIPKEKKSLLGEMEFWVDQKTWFLVKSISTVGENRSEIVYTKLDTSTKFAEDTFKINLPKDVEIKNIDEDLGQRIGTIQDAEKGLGKPFLVFDEEDLTFSGVEILETKGEINRTEVSMNYLKEGNPQLNLSIFPAPEGQGMEIAYNGLKVRGNNAEYMEEIDALSWDEDGLRYSILINNPDLSLEDVMKMTEKMKLSSSK
ncbi:LolA family protein [Cytobacillus dafuensis]|uniref:Outer membrane lipoprotein carrier protein LolA n=1 Tax=Cytobacillus dafuensis TaxID=1742359 RepID=A0A5B8Z7T0_CYTDA|nr:outer membrane lipoprotein-sorting protein [Cytobacillus dafuensis]QED48997.1 hypothetical protein FSZ17_17945 [Cytobacillus dafuensis]